MTHPPCLMCQRFTIAGHPEAAAKGQGWCEGDERYIPWDWQPCVLLLRARNEAQRQAFAEKHPATEETISRASAQPQHKLKGITCDLSEPRLSLPSQ